jgi:hypothetical protein
MWVRSSEGAGAAGLGAGAGTTRLKSSKRFLTLQEGQTTNFPALAGLSTASKITPHEGHLILIFSIISKPLPALYL